ncbi:hypothetical protein HQ533_00630 [Candidatus Woesearchaeota archaeon]|nr:hypothetical protein [Candidatus Woesearchaeota archaeon]
MTKKEFQFSVKKYVDFGINSGLDYYSPDDHRKIIGIVEESNLHKKNLASIIKASDGKIIKETFSTGFNAACEVFVCGIGYQSIGSVDASSTFDATKIVLDAFLPYGIDVVSITASESEVSNQFKGGQESIRWEKGLLFDDLQMHENALRHVLEGYSRDDFLNEGPFYELFKEKLYVINSKEVKENG